MIKKDFIMLADMVRDLMPTPNAHAGSGVYHIPGPLELSNFAAFGKELDRAGIEYEVHRFGHWGPGWYEIYLVTPTDEARKLIESLESRLADYPILDEDDFSRREWEEAEETWRNCYSLRERIELIREYGDGNIFAARRDELPADPTGAILERLTRN